MRDGRRFRLVYVKKDGSERAATGVILSEHKDTFRYKDYVRYFDLGKMAHRSFNIHTIKRIEYL